MLFYYILIKFGDKTIFLMRRLFLSLAAKVTSFIPWHIVDNVLSLACKENGKIVMILQAISRFTHGKLVKFSHGNLLR